MREVRSQNSPLQLKISPAEDRPPFCRFSEKESFQGVAYVLKPLFSGDDFFFQEWAFCMVLFAL